MRRHEWGSKERVGTRRLVEARIRSEQAFKDARAFEKLCPRPASGPEIAQVLARELEASDQAQRMAEHRATEKERLLAGPCVKLRVPIAAIERLVNSDIPCELTQDGLVKVPECYAELAKADTPHEVVA